MLAQHIAQVTHAANRALQQVLNDPNNPVSPEWANLSEETRQSAIVGVQKALDGATPEQLHEEWCKFKTEHGWIHGPIKNERAKTHPCLVPYSDLPMRERLKDALFRNIVNTFAPEGQ